MKKLVNEGLSKVAVSLYGAFPKTHDSFTGVSGSFKKSIKGIKEFLKQKAKVVIESMITRQNLSELPRIISLAKDLDVELLNIGTPFPSGRAKENLSILLPKDSYELIYQVVNRSSENRDKRIAYTCSLRKFNPRTLCAAGVVMCGVTSEGFVVPCLPLRYISDLFIGGNIKTTSLDSIWNMSQIFRYIRNSANLSPWCNDCRNKTTCFGGCKLRAFYDYGDAMCGDPFCEKTARNVRKIFLK